MYYLCHDKNNGCSSSTSTKGPCFQTSGGKLETEKPIFQTNGNFFTVNSSHLYDEVTFDFYVSKPDLVMNFISLSKE
jgi:hypothetical protein